MLNKLDGEKDKTTESGNRNRKKQDETQGWGVGNDNHRTTVLNSSRRKVNYEESKEFELN